MTVLDVVKKLLFYGGIYAVGFFVFDKIELVISGKAAATVLGTVSVVFALTHSLNMAVISKVCGVSDLSYLSHWQADRLIRRIDDRRTVAFHRGVIGLLFTVSAIGSAAYMFILNGDSAPAIALSVSSVSLLLSVFMAFLSLREFYLFSTLKGELDHEKRKITSKKGAIDALNSAD